MIVPDVEEIVNALTYERWTDAYTRLLGWLMVPVVFGAYHYGPGQEKLRLDDVSRVSWPRPTRLAAREQWQEAVSKYERGAGRCCPKAGLDDSAASASDEPRCRCLRQPVARGQRGTARDRRPDEDDKSADPDSATRPARPWPTPSTT